MQAKLAVVDTTIPLTVGMQAIDHLDLGPIKVKLMEQEEGEGWSVEQVNVTEKWYKRFLFLNLKYLSHSIVPSKEVDIFWHYHILDTIKYAEDCDEIFGYFLHHFPYFGMRGVEDAQNLEKSFAQTQILFLTEFGESIADLRKIFPIPGKRQGSHSEGSARCGTRCVSPSCKSPKCDSSKCHKKIGNLSRPIFIG